MLKVKKEEFFLVFIYSFSQFENFNENFLK